MEGSSELHEAEGVFPEGTTKNQGSGLNVCFLECKDFIWVSCEPSCEGSHNQADDDDPFQKNCPSDDFLVFTESDILVRR